MIPQKSLRRAIDANCKNCIYDNQAAGTWRQQVTLCSVASCSFYPVRPVTRSVIPESVLNYYSVTGPERDRYTLKNTLEGPFSDQTRSGEYQHESAV